MLLLFSPVPDWARRPAPAPAPMSLSMEGPSLTIPRPQGPPSPPTTMATAPRQAPRCFQQWGEILSKENVDILRHSFGKLRPSFRSASDPWQMVSLGSNCFKRVNHFIPFKVLVGDQVCWRGVHQRQCSLRPRGDQDGRPQQGGHATGHHRSGPQVSGGKDLHVFTTFLEHFYKTLSFPTDGSIFTPNVISSFLKLLNARKSFNYYSYKTETKMFFFTFNNYRSLRDILSFPE